MSGVVRLIKRRIKSASNIGKVTKAMEMVASSKMRQAKLKAQASRPYSQKIYEITSTLMSKIDLRLHPLLQAPQKDSRPLVLLISTNRGLCGSLNLNLFRKVVNFVSEKSQKEQSVFDYITLGAKGVDFCLKMGGGFMADFSDLAPFNQTVPAITKLVSNQFISKKNTSVWLIYNVFINALKQEATIKKILPITEIKTEPASSTPILKKEEYLIEPNPRQVAEFLLPFYLEDQIMEAILQQEASEYASRMLAMKNATDNVSDLKAGLTLEFNKARQGQITTEIADIVTAKVSMEKK